MMKIALIGHGKMGRMLDELIAHEDDMQVTGIVDVNALASLAEIDACDVAIDFSYPGNLDALLDEAQRRGIALVIGTTGLTSAQEEAIHAASQHIPIVYAQNYSMGVAVLRRALREVAGALKDDFDIEIVETHHNQKVDAPSGTAKMLLKAVDPEGEFEVKGGREGMTGKRGREIGMHALRGGTVAGEHSVHFFGAQEELEFRHRADSREIFARGALKAAKFVTEQQPGLYDMDDVLFGGKA